MHYLRCFPILIFLTSLSFGKMYSGYTEPFTLLDLSFPEVGIIANIDVQEGNTVQKGQLLASLDNDVLKAELSIAQEKVKLNQKRYKKLKELYDRGKASLDELENTQTSLMIEKYTVERIEAQIRRRTLVSNIDGIVTQIYKEVSEGVANIETPVMTLVQIDKLLLNLYVDFQDAQKLKVGSTWPITFNLKEEKASGKIVFISPDADKASGTLRVKMEINNPEHAYSSGILGNVEID